MAHHVLDKELRTGTSRKLNVNEWLRLIRAGLNLPDVVTVHDYGNRWFVRDVSGQTHDVALKSA